MNGLKEYWDVIGVLETMFDEVNGYDFYKEIFPNGEQSDERHEDFSHPNAIFLYHNEEKGYKDRKSMYCDTWEQDYMDFVERKENCVCGGLTYRKRKNLLENAQQMNALIFDLDEVGKHELKNLLLRFTLSPGTLRSLPLPTFLVASGSGVHLYYVFDEPIDLFPNIKVQLKSMKHDLTFKIWEYKATSRVKSIQYQSINQGFRMVGSINEKYNAEVRAFRVGGKVNIAYLNKYVIDPLNRVDLEKRFKPSKMTREQAKLTYPEWYEKVIVNGDKSRKQWNIGYRKKKKIKDFALYEWYLNNLDKAKGGHRYFFLMCMSIYAYKNGVPKQKLKEDMEWVYQELKKIEHTNPMKREDIKSALEAYDKEYFNFTISDIEKLTDIRIERNRRNYQKQEDHLEEARAIRDLRMKRRGKVWWEGNGRPKGSGTAKEKVRQYRASHPEANVTEIARALNISRTTVYKWWDVEVSHEIQEEKTFNWKETLSDAVGLPTDDTMDFLEKIRKELGTEKEQAKNNSDT